MTDRYWSTLTSTCGRIESTRFKLLTYNLRSLLIRFSFELPFNEDSRGGSRESNIRLVPPFMQMGLYLLDEKNSTQRLAYEQILTLFISSLKESKLSWLDSMNKEENIHFCLILSLFLHSKEEWIFWKFNLFERLLFQIFVDHFPSIGSSSASSSDSNNNKQQDQQQKEENSSVDINYLFKLSKPILLFFSLIDKFQVLFKGDSNVNPSVDGTVSHSSNEQWIVDLKDKLKSKSSELSDQSKQLLDDAEDMLFPCESFTELIDEAGILPNILERSDSVDNFILNSLAEYKSLRKGGSS